MENASPEWQRVKTGYEINNQLFSFQVACSAEGKGARYPTNTKIDPLDIDKLIHLTKAVEIPAFGSVIARGHTKATMMMGHQL